MALAICERCMLVKRYPLQHTPCFASRCFSLMGRLFKREGGSRVLLGDVS